jgi:integrase
MVRRRLPPAVYRKHGAYYLVRRNKWIRLGADESTALGEYGRIMAGVAAPGSMPALIEKMLPRVLRSERTGRPHAPETQRQYKQCAKLLSSMLAQLSVDSLSTKDVRDLRRELQATPAVANRTLTVLKMLLDEAVRDDLIAVNPAIGVPRYKMAARTRRITDAEYRRIHAHADPLLRAAMDLCYATGQRIGDVLAIRVADITDDGIAFQQQKTGARLVVAWTDDLRAAVAAAKALHPLTLHRAYLLGHTTAPTYAMAYKRWRKARMAAGVADANIHDLRAMAGTDVDAQGHDAQRLLGHRDRRTTVIYLRDKVVPVVTGPTRKRGGS